MRRPSSSTCATCGAQPRRRPRHQAAPLSNRLQACWQQPRPARACKTAAARQPGTASRHAADPFGVASHCTILCQGDVTEPSAHTSRAQADAGKAGRGPRGAPRAGGAWRAPPPRTRPRLPAPAPGSGPRPRRRQPARARAPTARARGQRPPPRPRQRRRRGQQGLTPPCVGPAPRLRLRLRLRRRRRRRRRRPQAPRGLLAGAAAARGNAGARRGAARAALRPAQRAPTIIAAWVEHACLEAQTVVASLLTC